MSTLNSFTQFTYHRVLNPQIYYVTLFACTLSTIQYAHFVNNKQLFNIKQTEQLYGSPNDAASMTIKKLLGNAFTCFRMYCYKCTTLRCVGILYSTKSLLSRL